MRKVIVNVESIENLLAMISAFNALDLRNIQFYKQGKPLDIPPETIEKFRYMGLANKDFVALEFWEERAEDFVATDPPEPTIHDVRYVVQEWLNKQGHDRCWYYPELFRQLASLLGVEPQTEPELPPRTEFEEGCRRYQQEQYHDVRSDEEGS